MHSSSAQRVVSVVHDEDVLFPVFVHVISALFSWAKNLRCCAPITLRFAHLRAKQIQNILGLRNLAVLYGS